MINSDRVKASTRFCLASYPEEKGKKEKEKVDKKKRVGYISKCAN
jgi:hypothetical protein